jgi:hypothetical protein
MFNYVFSVNAGHDQATVPQTPSWKDHVETLCDSCPHARCTYATLPLACRPTMSVLLRSFWPCVSAPECEMDARARLWKEDCAFGLPTSDVEVVMI